MTEVRKINILAYQEGDFWVAQGIEHDIYARSNKLMNLLDAFGRALAANICVNADLGRKGLDGIKPAPQYILDAYSQSKMTLTSRDYPSIPGVEFEKVKITDSV